MAARAPVPFLILWPFLFGLPTRAHAQNLWISPQTSSASWPGSTSGHTVQFYLQNTSSQYNTWNVYCSTSGPVTCTGQSASQVSLQPGASTSLTVTYSVGAPGSGVLTVMLVSGQGYAQGTVNVTVTVPPSYAVLVTPDGDSTAAHQPNTSGYSEVFAIQNAGNTSEIYTISCGGTVNVTCTGKSESSVPLVAGATATVTANYSVGAVGVGTLTLTATSANASNGGSYTVPVRVLTAQAPAVAVDSVNPGATVERAQCLTIAMGPAAAAECGDLRLLHPLPATRTLNKSRNPMLLYNSQTAHPHPVVRANVTLPGNGMVPIRFDANLWNCATPGGCTLLASGSWSGGDWWPGLTRQIALGYDAVANGQGTGIYTETIEVIAVYSGSTFSVARTLPVAIVDRRSSPFGAGWWLAGVEQLNVGTMLWVGGDGSVRQYTLVVGETTVWVGPSIDHPDTLKKIGNNYIRYLRHRVQVGFDLTGKHMFTVNRLNDTTWFAYNGSQLSAITLPPSSLGRVYQFTYPAGQVVVTAPGDVGVTRTTTLTLNAGRLTQVRDPDTYAVTFGYHPTVAELLVSRTDKRNNVVNYAYDGGQKVASTTQVMGSGEPNIVRGLAAHETRGINGTSAVDSGNATTRVDGPRTDVGDTTAFLVTRYGAPRRITDALGNATTLIRADSRWPGLVTLVIAPNGRKQSAVYDTGGNVLATTDSSTSRNGVYATTQYQWDPTCDDVTRITLPEGEITDIAFDAATCNRLWQQDTRGVSSRVNFTYYTSGVAARRLATIQTPLVPATTITYDSYGNLRSVTSPRGITSTVYKDALGRDTLTVSPIDLAATKFQRQRTVYDSMDRARSSVQAGDHPGGTTAESLLVTQAYDAGGNLLSLVRTAAPDPAAIGTSTTQWRYDAAGRKVAEVAPDGYVDSTAYDPAGNVTTSLTRRGHSLTMQYDALNRLTQRIIPDVVKLDTTANGWHFPLYALGTFADTAVMSYDLMGNLLTADNRNARVKRSYNQNRTLQSDTLRIRTWNELSGGGDFTTHVYGLRHGYDLNGRRIFTLIPHQLGARFTAAPTVIYDSLAYSYTNFGTLNTARDVLGNIFTFTYDAEGRVDRIQYPLGDFKRYTYDADGNPITIREDRTATGNTSNDIQAQYDARGRVTGLIPLSGLASYGYEPMRYAGLGRLTYEYQLSPSYLGARTDTYSWDGDALGNITSAGSSFDFRYPSSGCEHLVIGGASTTKTYVPVTGRLATVQTHSSSDDEPDNGSCSPDRSATGGTEAYSYDRAGNEYWVARNRSDTLCGQCFGTSGVQRAAAYYDAAGQLRVMDSRQSGLSFYKTPPGFEDHRYDALGRRVVRRARELVAVPSGSMDQIQRFVWDGDHVVVEVQYPGSNSVTVEQLERDTVTLSTESLYFGRVIYLAGEGMDRPLSVVRIGYGTTVGGTFKTWDPVVISPHWDHQGRGFDHAFYGPTPSCKTVGSDTKCVFLSWPVRQGYGISTFNNYSYYEYGAWQGSLVRDQMDATGQMYRRNRYYDPNSGRFTQEDPIGLAGGLNLYGFAAGDPVNFSDPFGLCPKKEREGVICIDLFIQAATVWGFRGDNRGFNPDADRTQSRAQIIVDPADIGRSGLLENKSCLAGGWCEPPNKSNSFIVIPGVNGSFTVEWDLKDGAAPYGLAPDIKGSITFTPDGSGGYETSGSVDRFPSWAIYQRTNGAWSELKRWNETTPFAMFDVWRNVNW